MLKPMQLLACLLFALVFWGAAALAIRLLPEIVAQGGWGDLAFALMLPIAVGCIVVVRRVGRLQYGQLPAAALSVIGCAMGLDGIVIRWFPGVYGTDPDFVRRCAAWLLWGYSLSALMALGLASASSLKRGAVR